MEILKIGYTKIKHQHKFWTKNTQLSGTKHVELLVSFKTDLKIKEKTWERRKGNRSKKILINRTDLCVCCSAVQTQPLWKTWLNLSPIGFMV